MIQISQRLARWPGVTLGAHRYGGLGIFVESWYAGETRDNPSVVSREAVFARNHGLEIARERFAEGEINAEEFEAIKRGLKQ